MEDKQHFKAIGKIIDVGMSIDELNGNHLEFLLVVQLGKLDDPWC